MIVSSNAKLFEPIKIFLYIKNTYTLLKKSLEKQLMIENEVKENIYLSFKLNLRLCLSAIIFVSISTTVAVYVL